MAVLKADPRARRKLIYIILTFCVLFFIICQWVLPEFQTYLKHKQPQESLKIGLVAISIIFLSALFIPAYFYRYGRRILKSSQFPPPGMKVMYDTEIVVGNTARHKAYIIILLSFFMALLLLFSGFYLPYSLYKTFENYKIEKAEE
jgi:hypothetical protein